MIVAYTTPLFGDAESTPSPQVGGQLALLSVRWLCYEAGQLLCSYSRFLCGALPGGKAVGEDQAVAFVRRIAALASSCCARLLWHVGCFPPSPCI